MAIRLQKIIANAGLASRREAERLIDEGRVTVNGTVVRQQGILADPEADRIKVNGRLLPAPEKKVFIMLNKPRGCLTTVKDDKARPTVMEFFQGFARTRVSRGPSRFHYRRLVVVYQRW